MGLNPHERREKVVQSRMCFDQDTPLGHAPLDLPVKSVKHRITLSCMTQTARDLDPLERNRFQLKHRRSSRQLDERGQNLQILGGIRLTASD